MLLYNFMRIARMNHPELGTSAQMIWTRRNRKYLLVTAIACGLIATVLALPFVVQVLGLQPIPAQLLVTCVTALISYFGHRDFSFRRKHAAEEEAVAPNPPVVPGGAPGAPITAPESASPREGVA